MESRIDILNELKEISPMLAGMQKINVFTVPEGYFNSVSDDVLAVLYEENSIQHADWGHATKDMPNDYFDTLADTILSRAKAQQNELAATELRRLSSMLYSIQNENVFEVPEGYFESLSNKILNKIAPHHTKVILMRKRSTTFIKYAVAAVFTGMMALGVFKFTGPTTSVMPEYVTDGLKPHNVDKELSNIAEEDIIMYLQVNGENIDAQTVADQSLDEKDLPSQADYLMDEKALDKYFNNNAN